MSRVQTTAIKSVWKFNLTARADGTLRYHSRANPKRVFRTNRTGLCALHPAAAVGADCRVKMCDGQIVVDCLPVAIAPHQPRTGIRAIPHTTAPGIEATVRIKGEHLEMEDLSNWTDDSFKTYGRPLHWAWPYGLNLS